MAAKRLNIAVLDDYQRASEPHLAKFKDHHDIAYFPDTLLPYNGADTPQSVKDALVKRLEPFNVISTVRERTPFPAELVNRLPNLQLLLTQGRRNLSLDLDAFKARGIPVVTAIHVQASGENTVESTTEHIVTMILALARNIAEDDAGVKSGIWQSGLCTSLSGKTLGIIGLGRLGGAAARIFHVAFGMKIIAWSQNLTQESADEQAAHFKLPVTNADGEKTFKAVSREELFRTADVVSLHVVLSDRTRGLITTKDFDLMKPSAFFVNSSRGPLVVEQDLLDTLKAGKIRGAALDVFWQEPLPADSEWRNPDWGKNGRSHLLVTPHTGYVEEMAINGFYEQAAKDLEAWIAGQPLGDRLA
ncbi:d-isomer specific 2-hydroxyacid dehydrogenase [Trichoderma arundinaceum]|uniref:D-isomer specific 2-hydroxyacid dehydrogenase n=1 Tax=Trichoderma arundinaceum TaxID=490622 RepID=A0A395P0F6_TRIAR|nr:d-isomer specific 2-hydroxyacid dehydrogenase [Trichoderma arundinaceum]